MDTLGIEPRASRMLSGCDTTTPCAHWFDPNLKSSLLAVRVVHIMAHTAELSTQHHTFHGPNDNNFFTLMSLLQIHLLSNSHMCRPCFAVACESASAGNRTRVTSMATMYSTTRPLMLLRIELNFMRSWAGKGPPPPPPRKAALFATTSDDLSWAYRPL